MGQNQRMGRAWSLVSAVVPDPIGSSSFCRIHIWSNLNHFARAGKIWRRILILNFKKLLFFLFFIYIWFAQRKDLRVYSERKVGNGAASKCTVTHPTHSGARVAAYITKIFRLKLFNSVLSTRFYVVLSDRAEGWNTNTVLVCCENV